jgi:hypothetical protein
MLFKVIWVPRVPSSSTRTVQLRMVEYLPPRELDTSRKHKTLGTYLPKVPNSWSRVGHKGSFLRPRCAYTGITYNPFRKRFCKLAHDTLARLQLLLYRATSISLSKRFTNLFASSLHGHAVYRRGAGRLSRTQPWTRTGSVAEVAEVAEVGTRICMDNSTSDKADSRTINLKTWTALAAGI